MKNFTILENNTDAESPMVGTINNVHTMEGFESRFSQALKEHFDAINIIGYDLPDLFDGSPYYDVVVEVDGIFYEVRILETWNY